MRASSLPDQVTINWLAECVGMHPSTVKRRMTGLQRDAAGKLNRVQALEAVFIGTVETQDGRITTPEAVRRLTLEKAVQVRLQNDILRETRIPIDDVLSVHNAMLMELAGSLKAREGKLVTREFVNELFAEWRAYSEKLAADAQRVLAAEKRKPVSDLSVSTSANGAAGTGRERRSIEFPDCRENLTSAMERESIASVSPAAKSRRFSLLLQTP